jgi:chromosome segregation ATPase
MTQKFFNLISIRKFSSLFLIAVLLGSLASFPSYVQEAQAAPNGQPFADVNDVIAKNSAAIQFEQIKISEIIKKIKTTDTQIRDIKGQIAILENNPSANSKKLQDLQQSLIEQNALMSNSATNLSLSTDELKSLLGDQTSFLEGHITDLETSLDGLSLQNDENDVNVDDLTTKVNSHLSQVDKLKQEVKTFGKKFEVLSTQFSDASSDPEQSEIDPALLQSVSDIINEFNEFKGFKETKIIQDDLQSQANSIESQTTYTTLQLDKILNQALIVSNSLSEVYFTTSVIESADLAQSISTSTLPPTAQQNKGVPTILQDHQDQLDVHDTRLDNNESRLDGHDTRLDNNESRLDGHDTRLDNNESRLDGHDTRLDDHESRLDGHDTRLDKQQDQLDDHEQRLIAQLALINDQQDQLDEHNDLLDDHESRLVAQLASIDGLTNELLIVTEGQSDVSDDITALDTRITTLESDVTTLKSDVTTLESDVTTLKSDVTTLKSQVVSLQINVDFAKDKAITNGIDILIIQHSLQNDLDEIITGLSVAAGVLGAIAAALFFVPPAAAGFGVIAGLLGTIAGILGAA